MLPEDGLYRYLYHPGEQHGDQKRQATDFTCRKDTYRLDRIVEEPGNRIMYYLQDGPNRAFVRKELMHISEDTQKPPTWMEVITLNFVILLGHKIFTLVGALRHMTNMSSLPPSTFNAAALTSVTINEKPWTRAKEVCRTMKYGKATKTADIVKHLCSREKQTHKCELAEIVPETNLVDWPRESRKDDYYIMRK